MEPDHRNISPSEYAVLVQLAAHKGASIDSLARGLRRGVDSTRDALRRLHYRGLVVLPPGPGSHRVPVLTADGAMRASQEPPPRTDLKGLPVDGGPRVTVAQMAILRAMLARGAPMSRAEIARAVGQTLPSLAPPLAGLVEELYVLLGDPRPGRAPLVSLTDKGARMANGTLVSTGPRQIAAAAPPKTAPAPLPVRDLSHLVPEALRTRGGIRHPAIPAPAPKPARVAHSTWHGLTSPNWTVGGAL